VVLYFLTITVFCALVQQITGLGIRGIRGKAVLAVVALITLFALWSIRRKARAGLLRVGGLYLRFAIVVVIGALATSVLFWTLYATVWAGEFDPRAIFWGFVAATKSAAVVIPAALVLSLVLATLTRTILLTWAMLDPDPSTSKVSPPAPPEP